MFRAPALGMSNVRLLQRLCRPGHRLVMVRLVLDWEATIIILVRGRRVNRCSNLILAQFALLMTLIPITNSFLMNLSES